MKKWFIQNFRMLIALLCSLGLSLPAMAIQYVDANEGSPKNVEISNKELTRISIEGGRIARMQFTDDEIDYKKDDALGEIYITPMVKKPISAFVIAESGKNYLLVLKPTNKPADSIMIREGLVRDQAAMQAAQFAKERKNAIARNSEAYMSAVKKFIYGMATGDLGDDISKSISGEQVPLWNESLLIRTARYTTPDLYGQSFTLSNVSSSPMVLEEQEFYKKNVIAVAIRQLVLQPGEQTELFVVSAGSGQ